MTILRHRTKRWDMYQRWVCVKHRCHNFIYSLYFEYSITHTISEFISCQNYHGTLYVSLRKSHKTDENVRACINFPKSSAVMKYFLVFVELFSKVGKKYFAYFK